MPDVTRDLQPKCVHCGKLIRRSQGVWVHDTDDDFNNSTLCGTDTLTRKATPRDEIR